MVEISTSLLGANKEKIVDTIYELEKAKTDYFHIDVMDGEFVKNNTQDTMLKYCEYLSHVARVPMDVHLMVKDIKNYVDGYEIFSPNIITFHYEACKNKEEVCQIIKYIKEKGIRVGLSIKPDTKIEEIYEFLPYIHLVLIMTVEPGEGGQILIESTINKIAELKKYIEKENIDLDIEADGGINEDNSSKIIESGANILVVGSAILNSKNYRETIKNIKK